MTKYCSSNIFNDYQTLLIQNNKIAKDYRFLKYEYQLLINRNNTLIKQMSKQDEELNKKDNKIKELQREIAKLKSLKNNDGTNSSIPTSMTPLGKKKVIPNSRVKSGKKRGGQIGHKKHKLEKFKDNEITELIPVTLELCPHCDCDNLIEVDVTYKDELDYKVIVEKKRYEFIKYKCDGCNKTAHQKIPNNLKEENQYGPQVKATALTLLNQGNVAINKVQKMIYGFTLGEINLSEGYISKLQKQASSKLVDFNEELRRNIIQSPLVYWDDTVIMINKKRACLRYYGNEFLALYKAHLRKNKEGIDEDNILKLLTKEQVVVHDHNKVNYNADYGYKHAECNAHLLRDLKKITINLSHTWSEELRTLLNETNIERKKLIKEKRKAFEEDYLKTFFKKFDEIMVKAYEENKEGKHLYYSKEEKNLITRILDYKNEYLGWVVNFDLPYTNNLSERSLRGIKSKMKVSGQFRNITTASNYARIKSYIETCNRNDINQYNALLKLCLDEPYKLKDILKEN